MLEPYIDRCIKLTAFVLQQLNKYQRQHANINIRSGLLNKDFSD